MKYIVSSCILLYPDVYSNVFRGYNRLHEDTMYFMYPGPNLALLQLSGNSLGNLTPRRKPPQTKIQAPLPMPEHCEVKITLR